jgi:hypothetical protein
MTLITLPQLNQIIAERRLLPIVKGDLATTKQDEANFQLVMKQMFLGLPIKPLLKTHPHMGRWMRQIKKLAPELFQPKKKLLIDTQVVAPLAENAFIQVHTNIGFRRGIPRLYEWAVRRPKLNWQDRIKLWAACEQYSISPQQVQLIVLALHPSKPACRVKIGWSQMQHEQTRQWLSQVISHSHEETPARSQVEQSVLPLLDLESIPEIML